MKFALSTLVIYILLKYFY